MVAVICPTQYNVDYFPASLLTGAFSTSHIDKTKHNYTACRMQTTDDR